MEYSCGSLEVLGFKPLNTVVNFNSAKFFIYTPITSNRNATSW